MHGGEGRSQMREKISSDFSAPGRGVSEVPLSSCPWCSSESPLTLLTCSCVLLKICIRVLGLL